MCLPRTTTTTSNLGGRLGHTAAPWPTWSDGRFVVDKTAPFSRSAAPDGPFDSLEIGVRVTRPSLADGDGDGIKVSPEDMAVAGRNGVKLPGTTRVRFGRLWLTSAYGSENLALPVPLEAQYWNGFGFVTNAADGCTTLVPGNVEAERMEPAGVQREPHAGQRERERRLRRRPRQPEAHRSRVPAVRRRSASTSTRPPPSATPPARPTTPAKPGSPAGQAGLLAELRPGPGGDRRIRALQGSRQRHSPARELLRGRPQIFQK